MSFNLVFYGFEPEVFKAAFKKGWTRLDQPGLEKTPTPQTIKEREDEGSDGDDTFAKVVQLSKEELEKASVTLVSDAYWIN